eukprot:CAMPEP_0175054490 /NCGR_PEP_ID=MMETSP0052_2-20121109/9535_1 /TAXON_ID=51329 ORGANISM="Polytomella parva, Strain SAG 63-3" /NCGR_SAMPLE_ID=MMETSP0052_2 /ASSEMBLY_ACC=CAM_ASM_000194 /LENGTH=49 /DNA_ID=CAMNT_0016319193 /DNA_START=963 /DNA_END=1112 /DNA_ORIENTATION=+
MESGISNRKACEFPCGFIWITASLNERLYESMSIESIVEERAMPTHISD